VPQSVLERRFRLAPGLEHAPSPCGVEVALADRGEPPSSPVHVLNIYKRIEEAWGMPSEKIFYRVELSHIDRSIVKQLSKELI